MRAPLLLSKPLALLSALLLVFGSFLAYLLHRLAQSQRALERSAALTQSQRALERSAALTHTGEQLITAKPTLRTSDLAALRRVAEAVGSAADPQELLYTIAEVAREAIGVSYASIGQIDERVGLLTIIAGSAASGDATIGLALPLNSGREGRPWQLDTPIEIADPRHDQRLAMVHGLLEQRNAGTLLIVPLRAGGRMLGTLNLAGAKARHFDEADLDLAQALAGYAAGALANQHLRASALQAERAKSTILDTVSHEFRTPITAVLGFTELHQEGVLGPITHEQQEGLEAIHRNAHRLLKLVDDLLDLARLESGQLDMSLYPVEVGLCINEAAGLLASQFQQRSLDLRLEIAEQLPLAWADAMWLRRVLVNLLGNALRYTSAGAITVRAFEAEPPDDQLIDARRLMIEIEDTGSGIPEAEQQIIFDAFQRADAAQSNIPTSSGSGLGLAISKRAIDQMDGLLALRSEPNQGSTFMIALHTAELAIEHPRA
ncbi:MAG TPA: ATP-binding protein [Roseiflexaceae bacterium]|nr:ATP-binding protein [Roseiflexaceae bacterium]